VALALGTRRSTLAAVASAVAAMALAAAVAGRSCQVEPPGPEIAVREVLAAAKAGDRDAVYELLGPATRERLAAEANHATDLVGGTVRYAAKDLISIGSSEGVPDPTDITVIDEGNDRAVVELVSPAGRAKLSLVRVHDSWRVELPQYGSTAL
jgi:hypothetical protein